MTRPSLFVAFESVSGCSCAIDPSLFIHSMTDIGLSFLAIEQFGPKGREDLVRADADATCERTRVS